LNGGCLNPPSRGIEDLKHFVVGYGTALRRSTRALHLDLRQTEIAPGNLRQLVHRTGTSADQACARKSHKRPPSHACILLFLEDEAAKASVTDKSVLGARHSSGASSHAARGPEEI
jgi:hypothetical protein